eukprot:9269806-Pyramimonas_sp.AAC.1
MQNFPRARPRALGEFCIVYNRKVCRSAWKLKPTPLTVTGSISEGTVVTMYVLHDVDTTTLTTPAR